MFLVNIIVVCSCLHHASIVSKHFLLFQLVHTINVYQPVVQEGGTARLHNRLVCRHDIDHVINDEHNRIIIVVLAKHEIAPWLWFLSEPKHVGPIIGILIVFSIPVIL